MSFLKWCSFAPVQRVTLGVQPDTESWLRLSRHFSETSIALMERFLSLLARVFVARMKEDFDSCLLGGAPEARLLLFTVRSSPSPLSLGDCLD